MFEDHEILSAALQMKLEGATVISIEVIIKKLKGILRVSTPETQIGSKMTQRKNINGM